ncbi:hypothetical protein J7L68_07715 [bacterium]|nr:hypothetical protein [bacterium]
MKSIIFTIISIVTMLSAVEFSAPIKWHCKGYLLKFIPKTERHFTDGMMDNSVDMISAKFSDNIDISFFVRSAVWTGMGYQWDDVIFDPRDMHYSLAPGFKGKLWNYSLTFQWLHDCFHEVDRKDEPTTIWNVFELRFSPQKFLSEQRNNSYRERAKNKPLNIFPETDWEIFAGIFPKLKSISWFQYKHPFSTHFGGNINIGLVQYKNIALEFDYEPIFWTKYGGGICQKQYFQLAMTFFAEFGTLSFFYGYNAYENQPLRPTNHQSRIGIDFHL